MPAIGAASMALRRPLMVCGSGRLSRRSPPRQSNVSTASRALRSKASRPWTTILGSPVEPEVSKKAAAASAGMSAGTKVDWPDASSLADSSGRSGNRVWKPASTAAGTTATVGHSRKQVDAMRAKGQLVSTGTKTPPSSTVAQKWTNAESPCPSMNSTRSPGPSPATRKRLAAPTINLPRASPVMERLSAASLMENDPAVTCW